MKKRCFKIIYVVLATVFVLLCLEGLLRVLYHCNQVRFVLLDLPDRKTGLFDYDQDLGWKLRDGYHGLSTWSYRETIEKINSDGWRDKSYPKVKDDSVYRIAVVGCSRTYGYGVNVEETYPKVLEDNLGLSASYPVEVMNFGVSGYGLAQMMINYEKFVKNYSPDLVILQLYQPSLSRVLFQNRWRTQKPTFVFEAGQLVLANHPVPENRFRSLQSWLIDRSFLFKYFVEKMIVISEMQKVELEEKARHDPKLLDLCTAILKRFKKGVEENNAQLIVFSWGPSHFSVKKVCQRAHVDVFSLDDYVDWTAAKERGPTENPPPTGHWSPLGHQYVAKAIEEHLLRNPGVRILP